MQGRTGWERVFVHFEFGGVEAVDAAGGFVADAEGDEDAGFVLEVESEIFAAHDGGDFVDVIGAEQFAANFLRDIPAVGVVVGGRVIVAGEFDAGGAAVGGGDLSGDFGGALPERQHAGEGLRADGAEEADFLRDDVEGGAAVDAGEAGDGGFEGVAFAGDDGLQFADDFRGGHDWIASAVGRGGVAAFAEDGNRDFAGGGEKRAGARAD